MKTYTLEAGNELLVLNTRYGSTVIDSTTYKAVIDTLFSMTNQIKNALFWQLRNEWFISKIIRDNHSNFEKSDFYYTKNYRNTAKFSYFCPLSDSDKTIWYDKASKINRERFTDTCAVHYEVETDKTYFIYLDENNSVLKGSLNGEVNIQELSINELKHLIEKQRDENQIQLFRKKLEKEYEYVIDVTNERNVYASSFKNDYKHHKYVTHGKYGLVYLCMWNDAVVVNNR